MKYLKPFILMTPSEEHANSERNGAMIASSSRKRSKRLMLEAEALAKVVGTEKAAKRIGIPRKALSDFLYMRRVQEGRVKELKNHNYNNRIPMDKCCAVLELATQYYRRGYNLIQSFTMAGKAVGVKGSSVLIKWKLGRIKCE